MKRKKKKKWKNSKKKRRKNSKKKKKKKKKTPKSVHCVKRHQVYKLRQVRRDNQITSQSDPESRSNPSRPINSRHSVSSEVGPDNPPRQPAPTFPARTVWGEGSSLVDRHCNRNFNRSCLLAAQTCLREPGRHRQTDSQITNRYINVDRQTNR